MSFATDAKNEVIKNLCQNECCKLAELSAIIHSSGEVVIKNGEFFVEIKTDLQKIYDIVNDTLSRLYGEFAEITLDEDININKSVRYLISIPSSISRQVLFDCYLAKINSEGIFELEKGINEHIIENPCCAQSYVKGVFLTSVTANIVINEDINDQHRIFSGYHLEFVFNNEIFADDFSSLLFSLGISSKKNKRKNVFVLYIKEAEQVSDLLAAVGAYKSVLKLQNEMTLRQVRNTINRQNNCINANISKTVGASLKQLEAIEKIENTVGISTLSPQLQELCLVRLANTEETLNNLTKLVSFPITKSGINHQFRKIIKIAQSIKTED